jgi:restriction system protein
MCILVESCVKFVLTGGRFMVHFDTWPLVAGLLKGTVLALGILFSTWYTWAFLLFVAAIKIGPGLYETSKLRRAGMPEIDRMTGLEFEKYLEILFGRLGYHVERTRYVGDQGADLILTRNGERILVQAKRHSKSIGNKAVQEAAAARPHYNCDRAMVVANQEFTRPAKELARSNEVELWGRHKLAEVVLSLSPASMSQIHKTPTAEMAPGRARKPVGEAGAANRTPIVGAQPRPESAPTCKRCGRSMVLRESTRGRFWGCSGFPKCRHVVQINADAIR